MPPIFCASRSASFVGHLTPAAATRAKVSIGRVTSDSGDVGGLVGSNFVDRGTARDSYWDTQTSGHSESADGEGKMTSELQSPADYTAIYENWNVDLDEDGVGDDLWDFGNASQYPTLRLHSELAESG